jgi:hypothetical protein
MPATAVIAAAAQSVFHLANAWLLDYRFTALKADSDAGFAAWAGSTATFACACAAAALRRLGPRPHGGLALVALVLLFFSLDDIIVVHENLADLAVGLLDLGEWAGPLAWPLMYSPIMGLAFVALWRLGAADYCRPWVRRGLTLLAAAVALEGFSAAIPGLRAPLGETVLVLEVALEEALELLGWAWIAIGLWARVARRLALAAVDDAPHRAGLSR